MPFWDSDIYLICELNFQTKEKPYSFDVPCNLINYDLDNNDFISIDEFAEALNQHVQNTGVRELFVVIDENGKLKQYNSIRMFYWLF